MIVVGLDDCFALSVHMINMVLNNTVIFCFNSFLCIDPLQSNEDADCRMMSATFAEKFLTLSYCRFWCFKGRKLFKHFQGAKKGNNHE